jgi:hypothetical protein
MRVGFKLALNMALAAATRHWANLLSKGFWALSCSATAWKRLPLSLTKKGKPEGTRSPEKASWNSWFCGDIGFQWLHFFSFSVSFKKYSGFWFASCSEIYIQLKVLVTFIGRRGCGEDDKG